MIARRELRLPHEGACRVPNTVRTQHNRVRGDALRMPGCYLGDPRQRKHEPSRPDASQPNGEQQAHFVFPRQDVDEDAAKDVRDEVQYADPSDAVLPP